MTAFTQQHPSIRATSQLISSDQFKWGSWRLKTNLSALDYIILPFPSTVSTPSALPVFSPPAFPHSCLLTQCMNAPGSLYVHIPSLRSSTTRAQRIFSPHSLKYLQTPCLLSLAYRRSSLPQVEAELACAFQLGSWLLRVQVFSTTSPPT